MDNEVKRIPCKNKNCDKTILEATTKKTGGYCYPCYNAIQAKEREEYIRKNRRDVNLYDGINDPVEIIKIMHKDKKYDPLIKYIDYSKTKEEMYDILSTNDIEKLKKYAMELYKNNNDEWEQILLHLVCFTGANIDECLKILIDDCKIYEPSLFKNASDDIAKLLIEKLECKDDRVSINHILISLAMIGNHRVVEAFNEWKKNEPEFSKDLYCKPYEYALEGGWILDSEGKRKNLYYKKSYGIKEGIPKKEDSAKFFEKHNEKCQWCKRKLTSLFTIDLHNEDMAFLGFKEDKISISTCENCTCYGFIYTNIDEEGNAIWSEYNIKPEYLYVPDEVEEFNYDKEIYIDNNVKTENYAANQFLDVKFTKIGGMPTWIQDAEYPQCPKCGEKMMFVGQVSMEDLEEYGEGIYYGFICNECKIAATGYQQT
ncbi:hypothetical protein FDF11_11650 [Clostridium botulinum]|nr:hypothetical protein [Clostridium botulinum]NFR15841.1 hypothetical protein [Clostridium botulinum]NFR44821.1 hypothetical protein [Clostridium botulinum]NFS51305.1 hypothetical protein [Clostridium botulinum]